MNTFNNIINSPYQQYLTFESSNLYAFNAYTNLIQSATLNTSFITASNSIITSNISCETINVNSTSAVKILTASNVSMSNLSFTGAAAQKIIYGGPTVNYGTDTGVATGLDFYQNSKNYMIYVCTSSNTTLSNSPAAVNSCAGGNFSGFAMRLRTGASSTSGLIIQNTSETAHFSIRGSDGLAYFNSNVGIKKTAATYSIDVGDDLARKLTTSTWTTGSDIRIKNNIEAANLNMCYSNVKNIELKRFQWNSNIIGNVLDESMLGFIAQEVKQIYPKSVRLTEDYGFSDFHNLDKDQLYATLFGAVQKLIQKVEGIEATLLNNVVLK